LLDMEHSPNDMGTLHMQLVAASGSSAASVVRPPWNDMVIIKRCLDVGAQTILLPYVQSAEEAANAVAYTRFPPDGLRGVAGTTRASGFGRYRDYLNRANQEICVVVQCETRRTLDQLEAICNVDGI